MQMTKAELRKLAADKRNELKTEQKERSILKKLTEFDAFKHAKTVLCYVSHGDEISTAGIIDYCFCNNKTLAVPYCENEFGKMSFYYINSTTDLVEGRFGIPAPDIKKCKAVKSFNDSVIIVPALCCDLNGFRLGYGGGYYDIFLAKYKFPSIALCLSDLIIDSIPLTEYDIAVDAIITENETIIINDGGKNG